MSITEHPSLPAIDPESAAIESVEVLADPNETGAYGVAVIRYATYTETEVTYFEGMEPCDVIAAITLLPPGSQVQGAVETSREGRACTLVRWISFIR